MDNNRKNKLIFFKNTLFFLHNFFGLTKKNFIAKEALKEASKNLQRITPNSSKVQRSQQIYEQTSKFEGR